MSPTRQDYSGWISMALLALTLSSALGFLYSKSNEHDKSAYFENRALLKTLKQLDAELELDVLKSRMGIDQNYDTLAEIQTSLNSYVEQFSTAMSTQLHADEAFKNITSLRQTAQQKAELVERFKSHNSVLRNSLMFLPTAAEELKQSLPTTEKSSSAKIEARIDAILLEAMIYSQASSSESAGKINAAISELATTEKSLAPPVQERLQLFTEHVNTVLREVREVNQLLKLIDLAPTPARLDDIVGVIDREEQQAMAQSDRYRRYLLLFSAGLISLFVYAVIRLVRSHATIKGVNAQLKEINENLEQRVQERTQELAGSLSLLNATLDSTADGIVAIQFSTGVNCANIKLREMWSIPSEMMERGDNQELIEFVAPQVKNAQQFIARLEELFAAPDVEACDVIEFKDGRVFERYSRPQRMDGKTIGLVLNFRDITERRRAEFELEQAHRQLLETSRQAGMAEVASNVLHNVGNVLNSVNVSANLVVEKIKSSKVASLGKVVALLDDHSEDLAAYINNDPRGRHLPVFLATLSNHLIEEHANSIGELESLRGNIDHIKEIVSMQQNYSKVSGVKERINVADLVEDALRMNEEGLQRHGVSVIREFKDAPLLNTEKHKILQILVNLVRNAKYACRDSDCADKRIVLRVSHEDATIKISVTDNGVGISTDNMTRIFNHGFTTRKDGHGFGLHSGALAANELGGALCAFSDGPGLGATFTLELPLEEQACNA